MRFMVSCVCCVARGPPPSQRKRRRFRLECILPKGRCTAAEYQQNRPTIPPPPQPHPETTAVFIRVAAREDGSVVTLESLCPRSDPTLQSKGGRVLRGAAHASREGIVPTALCIRHLTPKHLATPKWGAAHHDFFFYQTGQIVRH